jgi:hypothetical protein
MPAHRASDVLDLGGMPGCAEDLPHGHFSPLELAGESQTQD